MDSNNQNLIEGTYRFQDLVDLERLQKTFERFSLASGYAIGLVTYPDQELLLSTCWQDICSNFYRTTPASEAYCKTSNAELTSCLAEGKKLNISYCKNGLVDGATPIVIRGVTSATLFMGQVMFESPDVEWFKEHGKTFGYDMQAYIKALESVPVVSEVEFKKMMAFLCDVAIMLAEDGLKNLEMRSKSKALQKSEAKFKSLVESSSDFIWEVDNDGNYSYVSPKIEEILGYKPDEILGKSAFSLMPQESSEGIACAFKEAIKNGEAFTSLEKTVLHKDGRHIVLEKSGMPFFDEAGKVLGYRGVNRDITERKKREEQIKKYQENLEGLVAERTAELKSAQAQLVQSEKLASIGQLAAGVAHEINNPVGFVTGNIQVLDDYIASFMKMFRIIENLKNSIESDDIEKSKSLIEEVRTLEKEENLDFILKDISDLVDQSKTGLDRVKKIVTDLSTFAREDSKEIMEPVSINDVVQNALNITSNEIKYKCELKKDFGELPAVKCHSQKISQVIINIIINASQAIHDKGKIIIRTYPKGKHACIDIEDNGRGIPQNKINKIFDPFFTTKEVGKGTGLGLSISYDIVKLHGGDILVESQVGQGTKITILLPLV